MEEKEYCKIVLFGLVNLLSLLFSMVFFISAYNIQSKKIEEVEVTLEIGSDNFDENVKDEIEDFNNIINNHYISNLVLFIFQIIWFSLFFLFLMIYYCRSEKDEQKIIKYQNIDPPIVNENGSERNINSNRIKNNNKNHGCLMKSMIVMLTFCQAFYIIELIFVPALYYKIESIPTIDCLKSSKNTIVSNFRDMIIVGVIFFAIIFLPIYIILLVIICKEGTFSSTTFCICFTTNISNCCICLSNCSKKCHTSEILREKNSERETQINDLIKYRDALKSMNNKWIKGIEPNEDELSKLNLFKISKI
jgi:hypothetical protein